MYEKIDFFNRFVMSLMLPSPPPAAIGKNYFIIPSFVDFLFSIVGQEVQSFSFPFFQILWRVFLYWDTKNLIYMKDSCELNVIIGLITENQTFS
jgi:hypothetical protein